MKVLILSCSTGGGHNACAKYLEEEFNKNKIDAEYKDFFKVVNRSGRDYASKLYLSSLKLNGKIFRAVYKAGELYSKTGFISPVYIVNKLHCNALLKYIENNDIDIVLTTHVFPSLTLTALNKKGHKIKYIFVSTDYEASPFNEEAKPNYLVIPKGIEKRYLKKKVAKKSLVPLGIPVSSRFIEEAKNIRKSLKISKKEKMILVTLGSMGFGSAQNIVISLSRINNVKVVVVCGTNNKLQSKLKRLKNDKIIPLGFVKNINDLLYSSDVVLAKPGGLSSTEVAIMNKPFVHIFPIPGVETYNTDFFSKRKMSLVASDENDIINSTLKILNSESLRNTMIKNQRKYINKNAAEDIVNLTKKLYKE